MDGYTKMDREVISVYQIVGRNFCAHSGQAEKLYQEITKFLEADTPMVLNFKDIHCTPTFLNHAIGQLYGKHNWRKIRALMLVDDIEPEQLQLLKRVIDNAKIYFTKKDKKMLSKQVQGEILDAVILRRERDEIEESDFHHLVREILKLCPTDPSEQHENVRVAMIMVKRDIEIPPHKRPPGAPGSKPRKED